MSKQKIIESFNEGLTEDLTVAEGLTVGLPVAEGLTVGLPVAKVLTEGLYPIIDKYVEKYIQKGCRGFGRYDGFRAHLYEKVDKPKTIEFLLDNWTLLNFDYDGLAKYTNTDNYNVLFEMKKVLMMAVLQSFDVDPRRFKMSKENKTKDDNYHLQYNVEFDLQKETEKLRPILTEYLNKAIFRRLAQQTIYGFI